MADQFSDRYEAGRLLADKLGPYIGQETIIYALPRGGVVLGAVVAERFHTPLELLIARKIAHPSNPEYAICAVTENGDAICNEIETSIMDKRWLRKAIQDTRAEAKRRRLCYMPIPTHTLLQPKVAIIIDDGVATGLSIRVAINEVRKQNPEKIIIATPVIPAQTARKLEPYVDEIVALRKPREFLGAIGAYYTNFDSVKDEEVISLMNHTTYKK